RPRKGENGQMFEHAAKALTLAWHARSVKAVRDEDRNGRVRLQVVYWSPVAAVVTYPTRPVTWDAHSIPFARDEYGGDLHVSLESHALLGGLTGAGKSGGMHALLAGLAVLDHTALVLCDPKRVELAQWRPRATASAVTLAEID